VLAAFRGQQLKMCGDVKREARAREEPEVVVPWAAARGGLHDAQLTTAPLRR